MTGRAPTSKTGTARNTTCHQLRRENRRRSGATQARRPSSATNTVHISQPAIVSAERRAGDSARDCPMITRRKTSPSAPIGRSSRLARRSAAASRCAGPSWTASSRPCSRSPGREVGTVISVLYGSDWIDGHAHGSAPPSFHGNAAPGGPEGGWLSVAYQPTVCAGTDSGHGVSRAAKPVGEAKRRRPSHKIALRSSGAATPPTAQEPGAPGRTVIAGMPSGVSNLDLARVAIEDQA